MPVTVYPRLQELLAERQLTVAELQRRIENDYGVEVDRKALYRLTQPALPVLRADMEIAGAVVAVLGVTLAELFKVSAASMEEPTRRYQPELSPAESRRMSYLLDRQQTVRLTAAQDAELDALLFTYEQRQYARGLERLAAARGVPVEEVEREVAAVVAEAQRRLAELETRPLPNRIARVEQAEQPMRNRAG